MSLYVRSGGVYKNVDFDDLYRRNAGAYTKQKELYVRNAGIYKLVWRADGPPPAPTSLTSGAVNGGYVNVGWAYAANEEGDYNRVEVQQPGDIGRLLTSYPTTTQQRSGYGHGATVSLEARTVDNGGQVSPWVGVPAVGALNALPAAASGLAFGWDGTNFIFGWSNPGNPYGDISAVQVYYRNDAEGTWTLGYSEGYVAGARGIALAGRGWDVLNHAFVRIVNGAGYTDSYTISVWTPPSPGTEKVIGPYEGNTFAFTSNGWYHDGSVRQGQFYVGLGLSYGMYFYGDDLYNAGHGHPAVGGDIFMMRSGTEGFAGNLFFANHNYATRPDAIPVANGVEWASTSTFSGAGSSGWELLPSHALASIADGGSKGIGIYTPSTAQNLYKVMLGPAHNGFAGVVRLRW